MRRNSLVTGEREPGSGAVSPTRARGVGSSAFQAVARLLHRCPFGPLEVTPMADIAPMTTAPLTVVTLPDEIDMANADAIGEDFAAVLAPGVHAVIADMTATTFCDSAGINMLIHARKRATTHGAEIRLLLPC